MAAITLQTDNTRLLQEEALSRRLLRWALVVSLLAHLVAFAILSTIHLRPQAIPQPQKLIEVKLLEPPQVPTVQAVPRPAVVPPAPRLAPRTTVPTPAPKPLVRHAAPPAPRPVVPAVTPIPRPPDTRVAPRPTVPTPAPILTPLAPRPAAGSGAAPGASGGGDERTPKPGGGEVGLGSGSRQGSLPGGGGGGSSGPPGGGNGSGSGSGPGTGSSGGSGPGSGGGAGGGSGPGSGSTGTGSGAGPGAGGAVGSAPAGSTHISRLADRRIPTLVHRVNPVYPMAAQVEGVQGAVKLLVTVTKEGKVGAVKVARSSGDARLDAAAVNAVKQWRYEPAVQDGIAREVSTYASVTFSLQ